MNGSTDSVTAKDHAAGAKIPAKPTWRHVRTLQTRGWTKKAIAHAIGQQGPGLQLGRRLVSARNARAIEALLDQPVPDRWDCHGNVIRADWTPETERAEQVRLENERARRAKYRAAQTTTDELAELLNPPPVPQLDRAACRDKPTWVFFPAASDHTTIAAAKAICATCPARERCLEGAIERGEQFGIWGGTTPEERAPYQPWSVAS